jgi:hypothetical protein
MTNPDLIEIDSDLTITTEERGWGLFPELTLTMAVGLLLIAIGNTFARASIEYGEILFWVGITIIFVPPGLRLLGPAASRKERIAIVVTVGLAIYVVKILHSPLYLTFSDELQHLRTLDDILTTHHLFNPNPMLPVSPEYPGLEAATTPFVLLSGLSIYHAALIVVGSARVMLMLGLFLFYEQVSQSPRIAGIGALLYMTNPHFVYFDAQFAYESMAIGLSVLVMYAGAQRLKHEDGGHHVLSVAIVTGIMASVITHHVTSQVLIAFLALWTMTYLLVRTDQQREIGPGWTVAFAIIISMLWIFSVANLTIGYLLPRLQQTFNDLQRMILQRSGPRQLFTDDVGQRAPLWEQITSYLAVILVVLGIPVSLLEVWNRYRKKAMTLALAGGAIMYPATQALRFTDHGLELAGRFAPFLYVALALILALGLRSLWRSRFGQNYVKKWPTAAPAAVLLTILFLGGVIVSFPRWGRMPGPYLTGADMRSVDSESLNAAAWALKTLGPGNRMIADRTNSLIMNAHARQRLVSSAYDRVFVPTVFMAPILSGDVLDELRRGKIQYAVVDYRLSQGLPLTGYFYDESEHKVYPKAAVSRFALEKFNGQLHAQKVFDSGSIVIFDLSLITPNDVS